MDIQLNVKSQQSTIAEKKNQLVSQSQQAENKKQSLLRQIEESKNTKEVERRKLLDKQQDKIEQKRNKYSRRMLDDAKEFSRLQAQKEREHQNFLTAIEKIKQDHKNEILFEEEQHKKEMEYKQTQIDEQEKDYRELMSRNDMTIQQIEEDRDKELKEIFDKNEDNKSQVHDMALKSKAELQLIKNKMKDIYDEMEGLKRQIVDQRNGVAKQERAYAENQNDIKLLYKQIAEKDGQIGDRETKIYQLKRKTQELEKFKFVLDDRIKELKKEITPKEVETKQLEAATNAKDKELDQFNVLNANMGFLVEDLRFKQETMQSAITKARQVIRYNDGYIRNFKNSVYWVAQTIDDYEKLKMSVLAELKTFVEDHNQKVVEEDSDILQENKVQMQFLKKSVDALHNKLTRESAEHAKNRISVMKINQDLITDISEDGGLKDKIEHLKQEFNNLGGSKRLNEIMKKNQERDRMLDQIEQSEKGGVIASSHSMAPDSQNMQQIDPALQQEIAAKKQYIEKLRAQMRELKQENEMLAQQHY